MLITAKYPELTEWVKLTESKRWMSMRLSGIKYKMTHGSKNIPADKTVEKPKPNQDVQSSKQIPKSVVKKAQPVIQNDMLERMTEFASNTEAGTLLPVEVLKQGQALIDEMNAFESKFRSLRAKIEETHALYKTLKIKI